MDPSPTQPTPRRDPDSGRVAVPEIAELLHLQRPAAAVAAAAVVLLGLLVTLVAPGFLPANVLTGLVVGVLALLAAVATAVLLDGRDPVLRGPRHLRRDGHTVLARMAGPDAVEHGGPVLAALERRLEDREHLGVVLTGDGCDPSELAVTLGRAAAAAGHTALVIDLRASSAPGVADVGEGTVRLGEAARLADDRPYAWIGAGLDRDAAASAAAGVARRPPRDLALLLVVAPEAATHVPEVLRACERTVLLVAADTQQRAMVTARLNALERAGARPETVVVGGVRAGVEQPAAIDTAGAAPAVAAEPEEEPEPTVPPSPAPPPTVPEPPDPDEPEPTTEPEPEPEAPPVQAPTPEAIEPDATDDGVLSPVFRTAAPRDTDTPSQPPPPDETTAADETTAEPGGQPAASEATGPSEQDTASDVPAPVGDTEVEGMAQSDALMTIAALDQLVADRHRQRDAG